MPLVVFRMDGIGEVRIRDMDNDGKADLVELWTGNMITGEAPYKTFFASGYEGYSNPSSEKIEMDNSMREDATRSLVSGNNLKTMIEASR